MNSRMKTVILSIAVLASYRVAAAELSQTQVKITGLDSASSAANILSDTDLVRARLWDLSEMEWQPLPTVDCKGFAGVSARRRYRPSKCSVFTRGMRTERQRYAEAWARAMHEDVDRILEFQHAYDAAGKRLYPNELLIDIDRLPQKTEETSVFQSTDRLLFFSRPACPVCDVLMGKAVEAYRCSQWHRYLPHGHSAG